MNRDIEYYTQRRAELDVVLNDPTLSVNVRQNIENARTFCTKRIDQLIQEAEVLKIILQN